MLKSIHVSRVEITVANVIYHRNKPMRNIVACWKTMLFYKSDTKPNVMALQMVNECNINAITLVDKCLLDLMLFDVKNVTQS